jgi:hypothetical protein
MPRSRETLAAVLLGLVATGCATTPPALHVIGVYEGETSHGVRDEKEISVNISDGSRPIVLALMAHDRTLWKVSLKRGVKIAKVILAGYHSQRVSGVRSETPIETYTYEPSPCERCWQSGKYFYAYQTPPGQLKQVTGLEVTSFQGRYTGSEFYIFPGIKKFEQLP